MIRRLVPHPLFSALLAAVWLLLAQSLRPGSIVLAILLGLAIGRLYARLDPPAVRVRHVPLIVRLVLRVAFDVARSNVAVAALILRGGRNPRSGFVAIPLTLTDRHGLAFLACIITSTPGTIWVSYDRARSILLIHVLELGDAAVWITSIKQRYERPLLEIFQ